MKIKNIDIHNYKGIENLHVDFHEGINLLIGNNGAGKTSLLNAISVMVSDSLSLLKGVRTLQINDDVRTSAKMIGDTVSQLTAFYPVELAADFELDGKEYPGKKIKASDVEQEKNAQLQLAQRMKELSSEAGHILPLLCFQRAGRGQAFQHTVRLPEKKPDRIDGYRDAFSKESVIDHVAAWCLQMDYAEYQRKQKIREYETFREIVGKFMNLMDQEAENPTIFYSSEVGNVVYDNGKEAVAIYHLSDGYQSVLCLIMELAYRVVMLNPNIDPALREQEGIVLIDEIDIHLHPEWQWKILSVLESVFPAVQFIIATHSSIVLSSAKKAHLYLMTSPNTVQELPNAYGYTINDILSYRQGSNEMPPEIKFYYHQLEEYLDHGSEKEIQDLMKRAEEEFGNDSEVLRALQNFLQVNQWIEEA